MTTTRVAKLKIIISALPLLIACDSKTSNEGIPAPNPNQTELDQRKDAGPAVSVLPEQNPEELMLYAVREGRLAEVKELLSKGLNVNQRTKETELTLVMEAGAWGQREIAEYLIEGRADLTLVDKDGHDAVWWARSQGFEDIALRFEGMGISPEVLEKDLWEAVSLNQPDKVARLIKQGAPLEVRDSRGATPLIWAAYRGFADVVGVLLEAGADKDAEDPRGMTALEWAKRKGHEAVVTILS